QSRERALLAPSEQEPQRTNLLAVFILGDPKITGGGTLPDTVQNARAKPAPARVIRLDVERAGAELENALEHVEGKAQSLGARERAIELDAAAARLSRKLAAREVLAIANCQ